MCIVIQPTSFVSSFCIKCSPSNLNIFQREGDQAPFVSQVIHNLANARADSMAGDTDSQKAKHRKKFLCCKKSSAAKKKKVLFGLVVHILS